MLSKNLRVAAITALAPVSWGTTYLVTSELLPPGRPLLAAGVGVDGHAVVQRGSILIGLPQAFTSAPDLVSRSNDTFLLFGRTSDGHLRAYDGRPGAYRSTDLGGVVR